MAFSDPSSIPGLLRWFKASSITGLSDGAALTTWTDLAGIADVTQSDANKKPLWMATAGPNGKATVRFDGSNDLLRGAATGLSGQEGSIFVVGKSTNLTTQQCLVASADEATAEQYCSMLLRAVGKPSYQLDIGVGTDADILESPAITVNTYYLFEMSSDGGDQGSGTIRFYVNGTLQTLTVIAGGNNGRWLSDVAGRDNFTIGSMKRSTESSPLVGEVTEVFAYDHRLPDEYRNFLGGYTQTEYALTIAGATFPSSGVRSRIFGKFIRSSS